MIRVLRHLFFLLVVRPLVLFVLGVNLRHRERLPTTGPAIIAANHNSHFDTLVLMTLFPLGFLDYLRPVAATDYFLVRRGLAWFARNIIGIIPLSRTVQAGHGDPLAARLEAFHGVGFLIREHVSIIDFAFMQAREQPPNDQR